ERGLPRLFLTLGCGLGLGLPARFLGDPGGLAGARELGLLLGLLARRFHIGLLLGAELIQALALALLFGAPLRLFLLGLLACLLGDPGGLLRLEQRGFLLGAYARGFLGPLLCLEQRLAVGLRLLLVLDRLQVQSRDFGQRRGRKALDERTKRCVVARV